MNAAIWLSEFVGNGASHRTMLDHRGAFEMAMRAALLRSHPDRGGNVEDFKRAQQTKRTLERHHANRPAGGEDAGGARA
jgi:hypothetical protein